MRHMHTAVGVVLSCHFWCPYPWVRPQRQRGQIRDRLEDIRDRREDVPDRREDRRDWRR
jgi:hypothetical protein